MRGNVRNIEIDAVTGAMPVLTKVKDFRDIPIELRWEALNSELVKKELLTKLSADVRKFFIDGFLNPSEEKLEKLKKIFSSPRISVPASYIINHKISSHKALEAIYIKYPEGLLDKYFYQSPAGDAIPDRLEAVVKNVPYWIRKAGENKDIIKVIVPGSGPGRDIIRILVENPDLRKRVKAYCIDNEVSAIRSGKKLAQEAGVIDNIKYIEGDLMKVDYSDMDVALLVGIICPLPKRVSIKVVSRVVSYCRKGGFVIVSAALKRMLIEDPVTCFVMHFIGWRLSYKEESEVEEIIRKSGLIQCGLFYDQKRKFHLITVGQKI